MLLVLLKIKGNVALVGHFLALELLKDYAKSQLVHWKFFHNSSLWIVLEVMEQWDAMVEQWLMHLTMLRQKVYVNSSFIHTELQNNHVKIAHQVSLFQDIQKLRDVYSCQMHYHRLLFQLLLMLQIGSLIAVEYLINANQIWIMVFWLWVPLVDGGK